MKNDRKVHIATSLSVLAFFIAGAVIIANNDLTNQSKESPSTITYKEPKKQTRKIGTVIEVPDTSADENSENVPEENAQKEQTYIPATNYYYGGNNSETPHSDNGPVNPSQNDEPQDGPDQHDDQGQGDPQTPPEPEDPYIHENDDPYDPNVKYMQTITYSDIESMSDGEEITLVDKRDGKEYLVRKEYIQIYGSDYPTLVMVNSLSLGSDEKPMYLTPKYTNISKNYVLPKSSEWDAAVDRAEEYDYYSNYNEEDLSEEELIALNIDENGNYKYTDRAAIASSDYSYMEEVPTMVQYNVTESICPRNWHLPVTGSNYNSLDEPQIEGMINEVDFIRNIIFNNEDDHKEYIANGTLHRIFYDSGNSYIGADYYVPFATNRKTNVYCIWGSSQAADWTTTIDMNGGEIAYAGELDEESWTYKFEKSEKLNINFSSHSEVYLKYYGKVVEREGYTLLGFSRNKDATEPDKGLSINNELKLMDKDVIYAVWKNNNATIDNPEDYIYEDNSPYDPNVRYMQTIGYAEINDMNIGDTMELVDKRNGETYTVKRVRYGMDEVNTIVMTEDLKLGSTEKPMVLTSEYSDVSGRYILPKATTETPEAGEPKSVVKIDGSDYKYTNLAAIATSDYSEMYNTEGEAYEDYNVYDSICPKGWHLPMTWVNGKYNMPFKSPYGNELQQIEDDIWEKEYNTFATATLHSIMQDDGTYLIGAGFFHAPFENNELVGVRCFWGESLLNEDDMYVTIDGNGGKVFGESGLWYGGWVEADSLYIPYHVWYMDGFCDNFYVERDGYYYLGLSRNKDATSPDPDLMNCKNMNIRYHDKYYAVWQKATPVAVKYIMNGGSYYDEENDINLEELNTVYDWAFISRYNFENGEAYTNATLEDSYTEGDTVKKVITVTSGPNWGRLEYDLAEGDTVCFGEGRRMPWDKSEADYLAEFYDHDGSGECFTGKGAFGSIYKDDGFTLQYNITNPESKFALEIATNVYYRGVQSGIDPKEYNITPPEGYEFVGWSTTPDGEVEYVPSETATSKDVRVMDLIDRDIVLYAIYMQI